MTDNKKSQFDDPFSKLMFGDKIKRDTHVMEEEEGKNQNNSTINYEELFNQIDIIVESASKLKPLLSKVSPLVEKYFLKKK